ncbi:MAG: hypothetical protein JW983_08105 [Elusimicrobia bacterium]|nr:hypothetical protein [Elusimicrobiota bacterium]
MKINMKVLRWILLGLYIAVIIGLFGMAYAGKDLAFLDPLATLKGKPFWTFFVFAITIISQLLFIFGIGTIDLCRPVRRRRLIAPVIIVSFMMAILVVALYFSMIELVELKIDNEHWFEYSFFIVMGLSWIIWGIIFFIKYKDIERYKVLKKLISTVIAGSLIELLAAVPSHIIVSRRPGCFVGILTACGISGGIIVMLWAFGPGIIFLFLREKYKNIPASPERERGEKTKAEGPPVAETQEPKNSRTQEQSL